MTALADLQRSFQAYLLGEASAPPPTVAGTGAASAESRLRVYAEAIGLRFIEVLGEDYPGLRAMLGEEAFEALARAYSAAHPSRHRSIRWFGRQLPGFLRDKPPWRERPVLGEMASFEWFKGELVDAADSPVVSVADVAAIPADCWGDIRPRLVPAERRLVLEWNVPTLWSAVDAGETPPSPTRYEHALVWLLWRRDISILWRSIHGDEAWALEACAAGEGFDFILSGLCERVGPDAAAMRAATFLKQWTSDGLLAAV